MRKTTYFALGSALVLSLGFVAAESTTTFASKLAGLSTGPQLTVVNRTHKGDRLAVNSTVMTKSTAVTTEIYSATQSHPTKPVGETAARPRRLLDGCDPLVSPLAGAATAGLTGRCMS